MILITVNKRSEVQKLQQPTIADISTNEAFFPKILPSASKNYKRNKRIELNNLHRKNVKLRDTNAVVLRTAD